MTTVAFVDPTPYHRTGLFKVLIMIQSDIVSLYPVIDQGWGLALGGKGMIEEKI